MFLNLRYVTLFIYFIIVLVSLLAGVYFKYYSAQHFIKAMVESEGKQAANSYIKMIWDRYYPVVGFIADKPITVAQTYPEYLAFSEATSSFFSSADIAKVVIYNRDGTPLYSSNPLVIKQKGNIFSSLFYGGEKGEQKAPQAPVVGGISTIIIPSVEVSGGAKKFSSIAKVLIPISPTNVLPRFKSLAENAHATLEIDYNIGPALKTVERTQLVAVSFIIFGFGAITFGVLGAIRKAEAVLEEQQETAAELSVARSSAEAESKEKSKFLANVTHELRTPLNAIIGFSEIINSESMGPINNEQYKDFIKDIHTSGLHLLSLINDILDFSKADENKLEAAFEDVDLTKVIKISVKMLQPRAEQAQVALKEELPQEHIILLADNKRLKQVILNLLSNAVKFTPEGGNVTIKAWKNPDLGVVAIEVADTGLGMEPQDIARALTPFGQIDNKLSRKYDGTGLGLPLTKKLVEIMRGKFEIKSEPGLGTSVTLTFPMHEQTQSG